METTEFIKLLSPETVKAGIEHLGSAELFEMVVDNIVDIMDQLVVDASKLDANQCELIFSLYVNGFISGYNEGTFSEISEDDIFS